MCSQRELAAFYMSDDSKAMKAYMDQTLERLIHPGKKDRKVLHNMVLQQAHQIKEQRFIARLKLEPMLQDIIERMKTKQISAEEIRDPKESRKASIGYMEFWEDLPRRLWRRQLPSSGMRKNVWSSIWISRAMTRSGT